MLDAPELENVVLVGPNERQLRKTSFHDACEVGYEVPELKQRGVSSVQDEVHWLSVVIDSPLFLGLLIVSACHNKVGETELYDIQQEFGRKVRSQRLVKLLWAVDLHFLHLIIIIFIREIQHLVHARVIHNAV